MIRVYREVYSKGNKCFLSADSKVRQNTTVNDMINEIEKLNADTEYSVEVVFVLSNFAIVKLESEDFIEMQTISTLEVQ